MDRIAARWPWVMALAAVALLGCGGDTGPRVVDPLLLPYVEEFEAAAGFPVACSVVFGQTGGLAGVTIGDTVAITDLFGDEAAVDFFAEEVRVVVFHELGHCALGRQHDDAFGGAIPVSIMNSNAFVFSGIYADHWDDYITELFR